MAQTKNKKLYLEALRILCIFLVIFNHTAPDGYLAFIGATNGLLYAFYLFCSVLCKIAVPIFFMISGALLLGKQESIHDLYQKRVLRMAIVLLLISIPNYILLSKDTPLSFVGFLRAVYTGTARTALWYLYAYLGFLIMLPFLRAMAAQMKERDYKYLFLLHMAFTVVLTVIDRFASSEGHSLDFSVAVALESNIFYPLMGFYVEHVLDQSAFTPRNYHLAGATAVAAIVITCAVSKLYYSMYPLALDHDAYQACFGILIYIPAIAVYFIFKGTVKIEPDGFSSRWISRLGGAVFGLYLIENFCRALVFHFLPYLEPVFGGFVSTILLVFSTMVMGLAIVLALKSTPHLKEIVNKLI